MFGIAVVHSRPQLLLKFFASYQFAGISSEHQQYLNSLAVQIDRDAVLAQLLRFKRELEWAKTYCPEAFLGFRHCLPTVPESLPSLRRTSSE